MTEGAIKTGAQGACPRCGEVFVCGAGTGSCWCLEPEFRLPLPVADAADQSCYCPKCLQDVAAERADELPAS